jgi:hypothetical protein
MNRLEFAYLDESEYTVNRSMVKNDTQFIAVKFVKGPVPADARRIWVKWEGWADPFTRDVADTEAAGWDEYVVFSAIGDSDVRLGRCWYSRKHKQLETGDEQNWHEWADGEDEFGGLVYATDGYDIRTGECRGGPHGLNIGTMVNSRGDGVHTPEVVASWAEDGNVSLTKYHMAERDLAFNPSHAMREAYNKVESAFYR